MGNGHIENVARIGVLQPGAHVGSHAGPYDLRLMPTDGVEGQCRTVHIRIPDLAVGHKSQLDERLEAVADTDHETVPLIQELHGLLAHCLVPEEGGNELSRAIRLITAGEAARNEDHLGFCKLSCHLCYGLCDVLTRHVPHHHDLRLQAGITAGLGRVVLTVVAREDRNQHLRLCGRHSRRNPLLLAVIRNAEVDCITLCCRHAVAGEYGLQLLLIGLGKRCQGKRRLVVTDFCCLCHNTCICHDDTSLLQCRVLVQRIHRYTVPKLQQEGTILVAEDVLQRQTRCEGEAQAVAHALLQHCLSQSAVGRCISGSQLALCHQTMNLGKLREEALLLREVLLIGGTNPEHLMSCCLVFR